MYIIKYGEYTLFDDLHANKYKVLDARLNLATNTDGELSLEVARDSLNISKVEPLQMDFEVLKNNKTIFKGQLVKPSSDMELTQKLLIEGKLSCLNDTIHAPFLWQGSHIEFFSDVINNHNSQIKDARRQFKVGRVTVQDNNDYINRSSEDYITSWECLGKLLNTMGGYLQIRYEADGDYLDWLADFDYTNTQKIVFAKNLLDIDNIIDATETYSACIPRGKQDEETKERLTVKSVNGGSDVVFNPDMVDKIGWKFAPPELTLWEDVGIPDNLLNKAQNWLNNHGVMLKNTLALGAVDLHYTDSSIESFDFQKYIHVISKPHNLEKLYLLSKIDIDILNPQNTKIQLGESQKTLYDDIKKQKKEVENIKDNVQIIKNDTNDKINSTVQELSNLASYLTQTAEEITLSIVADYAKQSDLEQYREELINRLLVDKEGFNFEFQKLTNSLTALGNEVELQKSYIRLANGQIILGKADSAVTSVYTNNALEFRYNGTTVAKFTNEFLEVRNIAIENQMRFGRNWAIRPGEYIQGKGYNLNDMWIGGNV